MAAGCLVLRRRYVADAGSKEYLRRGWAWYAEMSGERRLDVPLSQQTQESGVHRKERHPRTAIGTTDSGELIILVYSGRTKRSGGADYDQMITAARKLFPDIRNLMNVDGGGSSVLGLSIGNSFMELSYPSTSFDSCVGMVRPINTVFCVELT